MCATGDAPDLSSLEHAARETELVLWALGVRVDRAPKEVKNSKSEYGPLSDTERKLLVRVMELLRQPDIDVFDALQDLLETGEPPDADRWTRLSEALQAMDFQRGLEIARTNHARPAPPLQ